MSLRTGTVSNGWMGARLLLRARGVLASLLGLAFALGCAYLGGLVAWGTAADALARDASLRRLSEGLSPALRARGYAQISGYVGGREGSGGPSAALCVAQHEHYVSGKNGGWRPDSTGFTTEPIGVRADDGVRYWTVRGAPDVRFMPAAPETVTGDEEARFRAMFPTFPAGGRVRVDCARPGDRVFIEGCFDGDESSVRPCAGEPLTVTWGSTRPQNRVDYVANRLAMRLTLGAVLLLTALWALGRSSLGGFVRARPQVRSLFAWANAPPASSDPTDAGVFVVVLALLVALVMLIYGSTFEQRGNSASVPAYGHLALWTAAALAALTATATRARRARLLCAARLMDDTPTSKLAESTSGRVELAVTAAGAGERAVRGVLWDEPLAYLSVQVLAAVGSGKRARVVANARSAPAQVGVLDASGAGVLRMEHADADLAARVASVSPEEYEMRFAGRYEALFGNAMRLGGAHRYLVEESALRAGEALYIVGEVQRVTPAQGADYRTAGVVTEVGGTREKRIVVHAGDERGLRASLGREAAWCAGIVVASAALSAAAVAMDVWLMAR